MTSKFALKVERLMRSFNQLQAGDDKEAMAKEARTEAPAPAGTVTAPEAAARAGGAGRPETGVK